MFHADGTIEEMVDGKWVDLPRAVYDERQRVARLELENDKLWAADLVGGLDDKRHWILKQALAGDSRYYGNGGTIHSSGELDVEVASGGRVVAVWYRCQMLPFRQADVGPRRAGEMDAFGPGVALTGVEVMDERATPPEPGSRPK